MTDGLPTLPPPTRDEVAAFVPRPEVDPRTLSFALRTGRVRDHAVRTWTAVRDDPRHATGTLRTSLRAARSLHSRERRFVADALRDLCRLHGMLPDDPRAAWAAWMVHLGGELALADAWMAEEGLAVDLAPYADLVGLAVARATWGDWASVAGAPEGVADGLRAGFGADLPAFLAASADRAPLALRCAPGRRDAVVDGLRGQGLDAAPSRWAPDGLTLPPGTPLHEVPRSLLEGTELQDEGSQLVAALVDPRPGERILDLCAGAGGKTLALGAAMQNRGTLWATDVRGRALGELKKRAHRAGVSVRTALLRDDRPSCDLGPAFDAVLVDAPCSGTGVWSRHPEWRLRLGDLGPIQDLQDHVLDLAAARVRPGGRLVYATCSVLPGEDEARVAAFASRHEGWSIVPASQVLEGADRSLFDGPFLRTLPQVHGCDGFFGAVLVRL